MSNFNNQNNNIVFKKTNINLENESYDKDINLLKKNFLSKKHDVKEYDNLKYLAPELDEFINDNNKIQGLDTNKPKSTFTKYNIKKDDELYFLSKNNLDQEKDMETNKQNTISNHTDNNLQAKIKDGSLKLTLESYHNNNNLSDFKIKTTFSNFSLNNSNIDKKQISDKNCLNNFNLENSIKY